jgi:predicted Zn-dependent protease
MKKYLILLLFLVACAKVPITNRKQVHLIPESEMVTMSLTEYRNFLSKNPPVTASDPNAAMVKNIGSRISSAVETYMRKNGQAKRVQGYKWEFNLVNDKQVNAWCMPGGKVVVYTGLLPVTKDETSLAFVMGHEIAHAVAQHGNERMSQGLLAQGGAVALDVALANKPQQTRDLFMTAYGVGTSVGVMLPYSRTHESEADKLGMVFMALAGYNPTNAYEVWDRMAAASGGGKPPEILSTHPSDAHRKQQMKEFLPQAMKYYKPVTGSTTNR